MTQRMTPSEARKAIIRCMEVGLVPLTCSSPGMSKSALHHSIAKEFGLKVIDCRLSQMAPEDLLGLPMRNDRGRAEFVPFEDFPIEGDEIPKGYNGWMIFFDEMTSASKMVQAACYKICLDRMVGQHKLHENAFCVAAGNLVSDKAIVTQMSTALQSRLVHIELELSHNDFMDHAVKAGFDHRVTGFLDFQPNKLSTFSPDHNDKTFACPRTWEFVSKLIKGIPETDLPLKLIAGTVGEGVAIEFVTYARNYAQLPSYGSIVMKPDDAALPYESSARYAVVSMLLNKFDPKDFKPITEYIKRLPPEMQVIYFRGVLRRQPKIRNHPDFAKMTNDIVRYLKDDSDSDYSNAA